jgi:hypothetical protein
MALLFPFLARAADEELEKGLKVLVEQRRQEEHAKEPPVGVESPVLDVRVIEGISYSPLSEDPDRHDQGMLVRIVQPDSPTRSLFQILIPDDHGVRLGMDGGKGDDILMSRDQKACVYGVKYATKSHSINAIVMTPKLGLRVYSGINLQVEKQIVRGKNGRRVFGRGTDLGWCRAVAIETGKVFLHAGVWISSGEQRDLEFVVKLLPDGSVKLLSWHLQPLD